MMVERPCRFTDWRFRLALVVREWEARRWQLGVADCARFAAAAIAAQTGRRVQVPDYTAKGRRNAAAGIIGAAEASACVIGYKATTAPVTGDVGAFFGPAETDQPDEWTLGVVAFDAGTVWVPRGFGLSAQRRSDFTSARIWAVGG